MSKKDGWISKDISHCKYVLLKVCSFLLRKKMTPKRIEEKFVEEWRAVFEKKPQIFNGLYNGLFRVKEGTAKKAEKVFYKKTGIVMFLRNFKYRT